MVTFRNKGNFDNAFSFLERIKEPFKLGELNKYGQIGVNVLSSATPKDTGKTASSWGYTIERAKDHVSIVWTNDNINEGYNIAILLQYGHGAGNGYYVQGTDYINPAMRPVFNEIAEEAWKEVIG